MSAANNRLKRPLPGKLGQSRSHLKTLKPKAKIIKGASLPTSALLTAAEQEAGYPNGTTIEAQEDRKVLDSLKRLTTQAT